METTFDKEIYTPDFQLNGPHLVEASAGTGKTYNIQNIYARLIMEKDLKVSQILVMTYTEAATQELRDRLRTVLLDVYAYFCGQERGKNERAEKLVHCVSEDQWEKAKINVELALLEFDQSMISTIHGFCQRILSRYAFDAGINFAQEILDNKEAELNALAEDWWRMRPADTPLDELSKLKTYVQKIAGKPYYSMVKCEDGSLLSVAKTIVEKYMESRADSPTQTFDDLLHLLRDALKEENPRSKDLIQHLRQDFKAALIDEFQDTDPIQYEIFERIFLNGNPNPLFFVGDPKQAIYAFRGGDIYTYLKAKNNQNLQRSSLNVNHRTTKRMMEAVNTMFADSPEGNTFEHEGIAYSGSTVDQEPDIKGAVSNRPFQIIEFTSQKNTPSLSSELPQILELMTSRILQILSEKNAEKKPVFSPSDIAILTNSNERSVAIQQRLMKAHIPSVIRKSGNVFTSSVAKELWLFLLAVSTLEKKTILCALTTVFCNHSLANLPNLEDPEILAECLRDFTALNHLWQSRGLAALIAELESRGYRKRLADRTDGTRQLVDISQIWELCFSAMKLLGPSMEKLTSWLAKRIDSAPLKKQYNSNAEDDESKVEEYARELETDEDAVRIMTVHTSKGLQFPIVFLPDCWHMILSSDEPYIYHDNEGKLCFSLSENAGIWGNREEVQEKTRLLYVAMTRAVQQMVLFTPPLDRIEQEPLHPLLTKLKKYGENPPYEEISASAIPAPGEYVPQKQEGTLQKTQPPHIFSELFTKGSFSSLFDKGMKQTSDDGLDLDGADREFRNEPEEDNEKLTIFQISGGAAIGSCWHNILERISFQAEEPEIRAIAEEELTDGGFMQKEGGLDTTTSEMIRKTLEYAIFSPAGERFSLRDVPWEDRLSEQEFNFSSSGAQPKTDALKKILEKHWSSDPSKKEFLKTLSGEGTEIPKGFMTGFMDLIFRHGDYFYIIDWKSNSLGGKKENFTEAGIRGEMAKHRYFFQYLLYATVLHFYLKQTMGSPYSWEKNFGGIRYFFLRGIAAGGKSPVFEDRPSAELLEELGNALGL